MSNGCYSDFFVPSTDGDEDISVEIFGSECIVVVSIISSFISLLTATLAFDDLPSSLNGLTLVDSLRLITFVTVVVSPLPLSVAPVQKGK